MISLIYFKDRCDDKVKEEGISNELIAAWIESVAQNTVCCKSTVEELNTWAVCHILLVGFPVILIHVSFFTNLSSVHHFFPGSPEIKSIRLKGTLQSELPSCYRASTYEQCTQETEGKGGGGGGGGGGGYTEENDFLFGGARIPHLETP
ncbi:uncharacterized protein PHA67_014903 [Liasis olivaceus]